MEIEQLKIHIPKSDKPRVVIIGGGFGGINLAKKLDHHQYQVVMIDRHNYHTFQPLLYQVATAGLEPDSIAGPLRKLIENNKNFFFRMATVQSIVPDEHKIITNKGDVAYDHLILATGSKTNFFGKGKDFYKAFPLKQVPQALDLRSHILQNFEQAVLSDNPDEMKMLMNMVIVGGGPTGVEVAGALGELKKHVLPKDYPDLDFDRMNIYLVEGLPRLLNGMSEIAGKRAQKYLKKFDVDVRLNTMVKSFDGEQVVFDDDSTIISNTLIWAAGVAGNTIPGLPEHCIEKGRYLVDEYNRIKGIDDIYAIGDISALITKETPKGHPMLAPVAIQQASNLAHNLNRLIKGKPLKPFEYHDKGSMATIGRNRAVVDLPRNIHFGGFLAWFVWMFVHLMSIIGFRNKLVVLSNWIWNYFTYDRGTRLIIRPFVQQTNPKQEKVLDEFR